MKIFGRTLKEYLWPIRFYIFGAVLVVISQYTIGIPLQDNYPIILRVTQALWGLMVALSVLKLVKIYKDFDFKNALILGILYSIIIHGLKILIRVIFYGKDVYYLVDRFFYGSFLVMIIVIILGITLPYFKKKKWL